jgi:hypothetical protein
VPDGGLDAEEHDAETYDDLDFYQHLLKDFIDRSTAGAKGNGLLVNSHGQKKRKVVDRRASKGRKIRWVFWGVCRRGGRGGSTTATSCCGVSGSLHVRRQQAFLFRLACTVCVSGLASALDPLHQ